MMQEDHPDPRLEEISDCLYRVAAKAIIVQNGKLLLVEEKPGGYGIPGGGIDYGDTPRQAIVRELNEELNIEISEDEIYEQPAFVSISGTIKGLPRTTLYYATKLSGLISPEALELNFIWVSANELASVNLRPNIATVRPQLLDSLS